MIKIITAKQKQQIKKFSLVMAKNARKRAERNAVKAFTTAFEIRQEAIEDNDNIPVGIRRRNEVSNNWH